MNNFYCSKPSKEDESTYQMALSGFCYWQGFCKSRCYDEMFCGFVLGSMLGRAGYTLICMSCDIFLFFPFSPISFTTSFLTVTWPRNRHYSHRGQHFLLAIIGIIPLVEMS